MKKNAGINTITVDEIREMKARFENLKEHL
jgi:hypothetical protein